MKQAEVLQEIRKMRFDEVNEMHQSGRLTQVEAADLLGISERTLRRWQGRYQVNGAEGLLDKRLGRQGHNLVPVDEAIALIALYESQYVDFNVSHFYDKYRAHHQGGRSYTWVKSRLQEAGVVKSSKKRGKHRRRRAREPMKGMMLHQDASSHEWVSDKQWDLIITLDDADSEIYSGFFVEEEGVWSSFQGTREVIEAHGLFCSFYLDRASHYFTTPKAGGKVDKANLTQFGRAMKYLGIELIPAYSPEARGRSERMFGTLQGRLPQELAREGIVEMHQANEFLRESYLPEHNERFRVKPREELSAFVPWLDTNIALDDILCLHVHILTMSITFLGFLIMGDRQVIIGDRHNNNPI